MCRNCIEVLGLVKWTQDKKSPPTPEPIVKPTMEDIIRELVEDIVADLQ